MKKILLILLILLSLASSSLVIFFFLPGLLFGIFLGSIAFLLYLNILRNQSKTLKVFVLFLAATSAVLTIYSVLDFFSKR